MLTIKMDSSQLKALMERFPQQNKAAMASALRSESYRLSQAYRAYASSHDFGPFAPMTIALRKGKGYGPLISRFTRYFVDPKKLVGFAGILSKDDINITSARFQPISRGISSSAKRLAAGYAITIDRAKQRKIAKRLQAKGLTKTGRASKAWGRKYGDYHLMVPRIGLHRVKPRPIAAIVMMKERSRSVRNLARLYAIKMQGGRWSKSWVAEWGNE